MQEQSFEMEVRRQLMCMISLASKRRVSQCFHEGKRGITLSWSAGCWFSQRGFPPGALERGQ